MSGTCYDVIYRGVRYTPAHQTMVNVKDDQGRIVASIQVNGTYGVSAHHSTPEWPENFEIEANHQSWEPVNYTQAGVKEIVDGR